MYTLYAADMPPPVVRWPLGLFLGCSGLLHGPPALPCCWQGAYGIQVLWFFAYTNIPYLIHTHQIGQLYNILQKLSSRGLVLGVARVPWPPTAPPAGPRRPFGGVAGSPPLTGVLLQPLGGSELWQRSGLPHCAGFLAMEPRGLSPCTAPLLGRAPLTSLMSSLRESLPAHLDACHEDPASEPLRFPVRPLAFTQPAADARLWRRAARALPA